MRRAYLRVMGINSLLFGLVGVALGAPALGQKCVLGSGQCTVGYCCPWDPGGGQPLQFVYIFTAQDSPICGNGTQTDRCTSPAPNKFACQGERYLFSSQTNTPPWCSPFYPNGDPYEPTAEQTCQIDQCVR